MRLAEPTVPYLAVLATVVGLVGVGPAAVSAQQKQADQTSNNQKQQSGEDSGGNGAEVKRSRTIRLEKYGARMQRPVGWVRAKPGKGAAVTLRAAGEQNAQIEIRTSSPVPEERRESFFTAFHATLQEAGFEEVSSRKQVAYGGHSGRWTVYQGSSNGGLFQLVVWQIYRNETAWLFVGLFPKVRSETYLEDFQSLLESLSFE